MDETYQKWPEKLVQPQNIDYWFCKECETKNNIVGFKVHICYIIYPIPQN